MSWTFDNSIPIYVQLVEQLTLQIIAGKISPGSKLNSVRDLAEEAGVNPNTMQRALSQLEREELIYSVRTSGRFVTENKELIQRMKKQIAVEKISSLLKSLQNMGYSKNEIKMFMLEKMSESEEEN